MKRRNGFGIAALLLALATTGAIHAEDEGWKDSAELGFLATSGNTDTTTLSLANDLWRDWDKSKFQLKLGAVRSETDSVTTAENYYLTARYGRDITDTFFWYVGAGWDRNEFSGIENRYVGEVGAGNTWVDNEKVKFTTIYALTYTDQEDVFVVEGIDDSFAGVRLGWGYKHQFSETTSYNNDLTVDFNLDESDDWRADMTQGLTVAMSKKLALKLGWRLLYDNEPAFASDLEQLDDLDSIVTVSLVINF
ncbi:MAG: DUF481 domain-containing protein [bacterium]|nr:DUF481 domain-containing protein [bacterium]